MPAYAGMTCIFFENRRVRRAHRVDSTNEPITNGAHGAPFNEVAESLFEAANNAKNTN
jgi:hypothetical protein